MIKEIMQVGKEFVVDFMEEEDGLGVVELVLIIVILIGLVILFKGEVEKFIKSLFNKATGKTDAL